MGQPISNGLFEVASNKSIKERGFNCMKLIQFLTEDTVSDWDEWHGAHVEAANGNCPYASVCTIYARTAKRKPIQLKLF